MVQRTLDCGRGRADMLARNRLEAELLADRSRPFGVWLGMFICAYNTNAPNMSNYESDYHAIMSCSHQQLGVVDAVRISMRVCLAKDTGPCLEPQGKRPYD